MPHLVVGGHICQISRSCKFRKDIQQKAAVIVEGDYSGPKVQNSHSVGESVAQLVDGEDV